MFILIPLIIIFLSLSYLKLNDDISIYTTIFLYILMGTTLFISLFLYKKIQDDIKQQEINAIQLDINHLIIKLDKTEDAENQELLIKQIEHLNEELLKTKSTI